MPAIVLHTSRGYFIQPAFREGCGSSPDSSRIGYRWGRGAGEADALSTLPTRLRQSAAGAPLGLTADHTLIPVLAKCHLLPFIFRATGCWNKTENRPKLSMSPNPRCHFPCRNGCVSHSRKQLSTEVRKKRGGWRGVITAPIGQGEALARLHNGPQTLSPAQQPALMHTPLHMNAYSRNPHKGKDEGHQNQARLTHEKRS